jgi:tartrate/fumarate subfamily iron-sulfur-dependent hydro-lyase beta chain
MIKEVKLSTPLKEEDIRNLRIGDVVYINGIIYTSRDMGHLKMLEIIEKDDKLPVDFKGGVIFHAGPVVKKQDNKYELLVIGPTTSIRMEPYSDFIGSLGVRVIIGKGGMEEETSKSLKKYGMVYLQAPPGCAVVLGEKVEQIENVFWLELGIPEALWVLKVNEFGPLVVGMDSTGDSIYRSIKENGKKLIEKMF